MSAPPALPAGLPGMVAGVMVTKQVICVCDLGYYGTLFILYISIAN